MSEQLEKTPEDSFRDELEANRTAAMLSAGKRSEYMKAQVLKFGPAFWDKMETLAKSEDPADTKLFVQEFAKLGGKTIVQEMNGLNGAPVAIQVINYRKPNDTVQLQSETVSA